MRELISFLILVITVLCQSCSKPTSTDTGGAPTPPRWVELVVTVNSLPAQGRTGNIHFHFIVTGLRDRMPVANSGDTLNYIRISLEPDPGRARNTTIAGDSLWQGTVRHLDTLNLRTAFTPLSTTFIYIEWVNGGLRAFDWAVRFTSEFYHQRSDSSLMGMGGYGMPYATFYVNTQTGETFTRIHASR